MLKPPISGARRLAVSALIVASLGATAQNALGAFVNLDFEAAPEHPTNRLFGWESGTLPFMLDPADGLFFVFDRSLRGPVCVGSPCVGLVASRAAVPPLPGGFVFGEPSEGDFAVLVQSGTPIGDFSTYISQRAVLTANTQRLEFDAYLEYNFYGRGADSSEVGPEDVLAVFANDDELELTFLSPAERNQYARVRADVSAYAGELVDLRFAAVGTFGLESNIIFDDISLEPVPLPPALLLFASAFLLVNRRRGRCSAD